MIAVLHGVGAGLAVASAVLALLCAAGLAAMRDAYQKLHFVSPPATLCAFLLAAAVGLSGAGTRATLEALLIAAVLAASNGVVGHATARALWVREHGRWPPRADQVRALRDGEDG